MVHIRKYSLIIAFIHHSLPCISTKMKLNDGDNVKLNDNKELPRVDSRSSFSDIISVAEESPVEQDIPLPVKSLLPIFLL